MNLHGLPDLQNQLLGEVGRLLSRWGFPLQAQGQDFVCACDGGLWAAHVSFSGETYYFNATLDIGVRLNEAQKLLMQCVKGASRKAKKTSFTFGAELGNLEAGLPYAVDVKEPQDVQPAATALVNKFEIVGLPFLEVNTEPERALEMLMRGDRIASLVSVVEAKRAMAVCSLLTVLGRTSEARTFGEERLAELRAREAPDAEMLSSWLNCFRRELEGS